MKFVFSGTLLRYTDYQRELELAAPTVEAALTALVQACPGLGPVLHDGEGRLRAVHRLFLNGVQLHRDEVVQALQATDVVEILTAIAGG